MKVQLKARSIGENISLAFSLTFALLPQLVMILAVTTCPILLAQLYILNAGMAPEAAAGAIGGAFFVQLLLTFAGTGAATFLIASRFTGQTVGIGQSLVAGLKRFLPILVVSLVVGLLVGLGVLLLIIPGLWLLSMFYVVVCPVVVEEAGIADALSRSQELTKGFRWNVLFFFILLGIVTTIANLAVAFALAGGGLLDADGTPATTAGAVISWVAQTIIAVPALIGPTVMYFDLRVRQERFDVEELSDLVDRIGAGPSSAAE